MRDGKERLWLLDTTLRDGQQTQGVTFSAADKRQIAEALDKLGVDYVEGGWPGANPVDDTFFAAPPALKNARLTAFGMTKRVGVSAANDPVLAGVLNARAPAVCLVGKSHEFHVREALGATLDENLQAISDSVAHVAASGAEPLFDAEHFFDGCAADQSYALACLEAAARAGARWVVLCDTNGGRMPGEIASMTTQAVERVAAVAAETGREAGVGIHTHNDTEQAVAGTLAAAEAGARHIQGTLNGLGERCGNANLTSIIATLLLKEPYASRFAIGVSEAQLRQLTRVSRLLDRVLDRQPAAQAAYVGASAFTHKSGLHASAVAKDPRTYEHVDPASVGGARVIPMSNQAGRANLRERLAAAGFEIAADDPRLGSLLDAVKRREEAGFAYDGAEASFVVLADDYLSETAQRVLKRRFFVVERFRVTVERRVNALGDIVTVSEAVVVVADGAGARRISASESPIRPDAPDQGPIDALAKALVKDLGRFQTFIEDVQLVDYRVRIIGRGTEAVTRVIIDSQDGAGRQWSTVGVSANVVDASFQALTDSLRYKLIRDGAPG